jgi:GNAT superfamily N-acetyltransferase
MSYTPDAYAATTPDAAEVARRIRDEGPTWLLTIDDAAQGTISAVARASSLYVRSMAILPGARGRGGGFELLRVAEAFARLHGLPCLELCTTPFLAAAIRLYRDYGFARDPTEAPSLFGTALIRMFKPLSD